MKVYTAYSIFKKAYLHKVGRPYIETKGRDLAIFKMILKEISSDELTDIIELYFDQSQNFYSPVFFKAQLNELVQRKIKADKKKRHTYNNLEKNRWI